MKKLPFVILVYKDNLPPKKVWKRFQYDSLEMADHMAKQYLDWSDVSYVVLCRRIAPGDELAKMRIYRDKPI